MGFSFFKSKNRSKQKIDPEIAAALNGKRSSNPQVSIKLAEHFMRENKRELAVDEYLHAAQAFMEKRQTQLSMAVYRNILTIDPERYSVYETLADLYLKAGFPGDGASVLLALAYQYKTAGCNSEVKRVLDSVLEYAPDNPVLKRKVQAFLDSEGRVDNAAEKPAVSAQPGASVVRPFSPARPRELFSEPEVAIQSAAPASEPAAPEQELFHAQLSKADTGPDIFAAPAAPVQPDEPEAPAQTFFDLKEALAPDGVPEQESFPAQSSKADTGPDIFAAPAAPVQPDEPEAPAQTFFDLKEALAPDGVPEQESFPAPSSKADTGSDIFAAPAAPVQPDEPEAPAQTFFDLKEALAPDGVPEQESAPAQPGEPDETARSFFDLQSALTMDGSLEFDHDSPSESLLNAEQERAPFSVLDVVKDIAKQDPRQDTPLFHFNLGVAYMQCAEYEQAVDEFLSALYGTSDKIGCYIRLAECSLKLHRRELACGFLREALDDQGIIPEQERDVRKRLDEISAG